MLYGYQPWSEEVLMQAKNDDDLCWGQRSTEVKYSKQCSVATKLGQKSRWCKFRMTIDDLHGGQRSTEVKYSKLCSLYIKHRRITDASLGSIWWPIDLHWDQKSTGVKYSKLCSLATKLCQKITGNIFTEVKGQQMSNVVKYVLLLPYLVRSITHTS